MAKVIAGTKSLRRAEAAKKDSRSVTIHKAAGGNITKIRCTFCGTLAHPTPNAQGGTTLKCAGCGKQYAVRSL